MKLLTAIGVLVLCLGAAQAGTGLFSNFLQNLIQTTTKSTTVPTSTSPSSDATTVTSSSTSAPATTVTAIAQKFLDQLNGMVTDLQKATTVARDAGLPDPANALDALQQQIKQVGQGVQGLAGQLPSPVAAAQILKNAGTQLASVAKNAFAIKQQILTAAAGQAGLPAQTILGLGTILSGTAPVNGAALASSITEAVGTAAQVASSIATTLSTLSLMSGGLSGGLGVLGSLAGGLGGLGGLTGGLGALGSLAGGLGGLGGLTGGLGGLGGLTGGLGALGSIAGAGGLNSLATLAPLLALLG